MGTPWDADTYDRSSEPQQAWASEVLSRLDGIAPDSTVLDVGCGTGRVTEALLARVPEGRVLAIDASRDMVALARRRLGDRAQVWCQDVLDLDQPVDAIVSTATLHWVTDHDRLWRRLANALRPRGVLEVQCGGQGNIDRVREVIEHAAGLRASERLRRSRAGLNRRSCQLGARLALGGHHARPTDRARWRRGRLRAPDRRTRARSSAARARQTCRLGVGKHLEVGWAQPP